MRADDLLRLVWSNLGRMKVRVAMTATGVLIGTAAILVLISLAAGLQRNAANSFGSLGSLTEITVYSGSFGPSYGRQPPKLDTAALNTFRKIEGVVAVTPLDHAFGGNLKLNRLVGSASLIGIDQRAISALKWETTQGAAQVNHWQALAGASVAGNFFDPFARRPGPGSVAASALPDLFGQTLKLELERTNDEGATINRTVNIRITGILKEMGGQYDGAIFLPLADVEELNGWAAGRRLDQARAGYSQVMIKAADPDQTNAIVQKLLQEGYMAYSARSTLNELNQLFLIIQAVMGGIGAIALLVAAIGIANTMTMAIYERTREIGVMKAVGASNRDVMSVFLAEAGGIGLLGGLGGVLVGGGLAQIIGLVASGMLATQAAQAGASVSQADVSIIYTPPWLVVFSLVFSAIIGIISGIYPALRAANLSPLMAIKYE